MTRHLRPTGREFAPPRGGVPKSTVQTLDPSGPEQRPARAPTRDQASVIAAAGRYRSACPGNHQAVEASQRPGMNFWRQVRRERRCNLPPSTVIP